MHTKWVLYIHAFDTYIQSWKNVLSFLAPDGLIAPYWNRFFLVTAAAPVIVNGQENKLAEVLVHVLGVKKYKNSCGKLGREGLQIWTQKTDDKRSRVWGRIASPGTARVTKLFCFW